MAGEPDWKAKLAANLARNQSYAKPGPYSTTLTAPEEKAFQAWVAANKVPFNPAETLQDYDMRGYYKNVAAVGNSQTAVNPNDHRLHFPDTYKTPYHQSFSAESQYALPTAPIWANDHQLVDPKTKAVVFDELAPDGVTTPASLVRDLMAFHKGVL